MSDLRTSVNQAPGNGSTYPFRRNVLSPLLSDVYLSYDDAACHHSLPFRISYLRGFGAATAHPGAPLYRVIVEDANDSIVFDSEDASDFRQTDWGSNRRVFQWVTPTAVFRCVQLLPAESDFDAEISPARLDGELDSRTYVRQTARVEGFRVGTEILRGSVNFTAGYNQIVAAEETPRSDGQPFVNRILFSAIPGAGLGLFPGCTDSSPVIRGINGVRPTLGGNFRIEADQCFRAQLPVFITDSGGQRLATPSAVGLDGDQAGSALKLGSDCYPCCDCSYYVRTYAGLRRLFNRADIVAQSLNATGAANMANAASWEAYRQRAQTKPLHLVVAGLNSCKVFVGGSLCNFSNCCASQVDLRFTLQVLREGVPIPWPGGRCLEGYRRSSSFCAEQRYNPWQSGPVFRFLMDYLNPGDSAVARMKVCIRGCQAGDVLEARLWASASFDGNSVNTDGSPCSALNAYTADAVSAAIWAENGVPNAAGLATGLQAQVPLDPNEATFDCSGC